MFTELGIGTLNYLVNLFVYCNLTNRYMIVSPCS